MPIWTEITIFINCWALSFFNVINLMNLRESWLCVTMDFGSWARRDNNPLKCIRLENVRRIFHRFPIQPAMEYSTFWLLHIAVWWLAALNARNSEFSWAQRSHICQVLVVYCLVVQDNPVATEAAPTTDEMFLVLAKHFPIFALRSSSSIFCWFEKSGCQHINIFRKKELFQSYRWSAIL